MKHLQFACCLGDEPTPLPHFWEHAVGSGHAPLAVRGDWQQQLRECRTLLGFRHTRFHGLLCDEMGTLMDERDEMLYSFFNADQICDFLLSIGMKPFVELSFMPEALASGRKTVLQYGANVTPPKDFTPADRDADAPRRLHRADRRRSRQCQKALDRNGQSGASQAQGGRATAHRIAAHAIAAITVPLNPRRGHGDAR